MLKRCLLCFAISLNVARGFDYSLDSEGGGSLAFGDVDTGISSIKTFFTNSETSVTVEGFEWIASGPVENSTNDLLWETYVDGELAASGEVSLADVGRSLPTSVDAGSFTVTKRGRRTVTVKLTVDDSELEVTDEKEAYGPGVAIIPLLLILGLAVTTHMVEISLYFGVFVGSCMVKGNLSDGFKASLDEYLLGALADDGHVFVILFSLFLGGLVGMMEKSGGMLGFTRDIGMFARTARGGQLACFTVGVLVFFDDYANLLLAGGSMRPLLDSLCVSREKLSFIVDATAAPIASISPLSSWVGFEVNLIQNQIDRIIEIMGTEDIGIKTTGLGVFLQSIKYRYYPIFMIVLMFSLIVSRRDFGSMLVAERKTQVYQRTDGGDGKGKSEAMENEDANKPRHDTPLSSWNMMVPILLLVFFIFYILIMTGTVEGESQTFMDKIEGSDSYVALLWGTMASAICTLIFYLMQPVKGGDYIMPSMDDLKNMMMPGKEKDEDAEPKARFLMPFKDSVESFLYGMGRLFPAIVVLTLAWASGAIMIDVGADRLFSSWIVGGLNAESLPTLSFLISFFMALATGTSWGTMSILFPLILVPTYQASNGDATIFYATTAGVLSGSVAGDHVSPISDTTVLSSLACDCDLLKHVGTQAPYVFVTVVISMLLGTLPIGYTKMPNIVGILIGAGVTVAFVFFMCAPVISEHGKFDLLTELFLKYKEVRGLDSDLFVLKEDTKKAAIGALVTGGISKAAGIEATHKTKGAEQEGSSEDDVAVGKLEVDVVEA